MILKICYYVFFGDIFIIWSIVHWILYIREANIISLKIVSIQYPWLSKWFFRKYFAYFTLYLSHITAVRNSREFVLYFENFPISCFWSLKCLVFAVEHQMFTLWYEMFNTEMFRPLKFYLRFWVLFWIMNLCDFMIFDSRFIFVLISISTELVVVMLSSAV